MVQKFSDVEAVFHEEINSKKKEFRDFKNATKHKRLGKKSVMFASDYMSRKEKLKHRKAGEIMTTNMYDNILTIEEFNQLETYEKRNRMQHWRSVYSNKEIQNAMGIANSPYYKIIAELDLPKAPRTNKPRTGSTKKKSASKEKSVAISTVSDVQAAQQESQPQVQQILVDGLNLVFQGTYTAEQIQKQLTKFSLILEDDSEEYFFEFRLMQKQPK